MKILITTGIFPPEVGGPATFAVEFSKRLLALDHEVAVITYADSVTAGSGAYPFPVHRVLRTASKLSNYLRYFKEAYAHAGAYDVIYSLDWFSAGVPVMAAAFLRRKKYVVRVGGGYIWEKYLAEGRPPLSLRRFYEVGLYKDYELMYKLIGQVLRRAQLVIFNSHTQSELYQRFYSLHADKAAVVRNAVSNHAAVSLIQNFNSKNKEKDKEIVYAGRFIKMKNVESLIQAFARLNDPAFKLVLIGDGPTEPLLRALVADLDVKDRVIFLPKLSQAELYKRISSCHMFVLPSWTDVSPHQAYECLALGIPILMTKENYLDLPIPQEYLIDPHSIEDMSAKMNMLLDKRAYATFAKTLSGIRVERSWDEVVAEHMELFKRLS